MDTGKDQESGIIGDEMQPLPLDYLGPANPGVPWSAFESCGTPSQQCDPAAL